MKDILSYLADLNRPRLLVRAARMGVEDYQRERHLPRLLGRPAAPRSAHALVRLRELELDMNAQRLASDASYCIARHIDVLIAIMAEARILRAARAGKAANSN